MTFRPPCPSRLHDAGVVLILLGGMLADSEMVAIPVALVVAGIGMVAASWGWWWGRQRRGAESSDLEGRGRGARRADGAVVDREA